MLPLLQYLALLDFREGQVGEAGQPQYEFVTSEADIKIGGGSHPPRCRGPAEPPTQRAGRGRQQLALSAPNNFRLIAGGTPDIEFTEE